MERGSGSGRWGGPPPAARMAAKRARIADLSGAGRVPRLAIALRIAPAVCSARNSTISRAHSSDCTLSSSETPLMVAVPAATRSS